MKFDIHTVICAIIWFVIVAYLFFVAFIAVALIMVVQVFTSMGGG